MNPPAQTAPDSASGPAPESASEPPAGRRFHAHIYADLERRLRASNFGGGAAEAHGVLCGLTCRGVDGEKLRVKAGLLRLSGAADFELIAGLQALAARDLRADDFQFNLLLPHDDAGAAPKTAAVADWCGGFAQGFLHDGEAALATCPAVVREAFDDIMAISCADAPPPDSGDGGEAALRQLAEIEEYLRVAVQLIFEELNPPAGAEIAPETAAEIVPKTAAETTPEIAPKTAAKPTPASPPSQTKSAPESPPQ
ncbi:MAG: UPF0149 family protein [Gammaproteobacteria bacterium]|nr:UPF0149 family protein [Gammaproteobacteria bacterium]